MSTRATPTRYVWGAVSAASGGAGKRARLAPAPRGGDIAGALRIPVTSNPLLAGYSIEDSFRCSNGTNLTRYAQVEEVLHECLAIRAQRLPDCWQRFNAMSQLGGKLLGLKQYA